MLECGRLLAGMRAEGCQPQEKKLLGTKWQPESKPMSTGRLVTKVGAKKKEEMTAKMACSKASPGRLGL